MKNQSEIHDTLEDLLYMAKRYVKKTPATETIVFDSKTGKELKTINYHKTIEKAEAILAKSKRKGERKCS